MASSLCRCTIVSTGKLLQAGKQKIIPAPRPVQTVGCNILQSRTLVTKSSGAVLPEPVKDPLGLFGFGGTVLVGLTLGATISKHIASFLEENELFVPSDDDDDD